MECLEEVTMKPSQFLGRIVTVDGKLFEILDYNYTFALFVGRELNRRTRFLIDPIHLQ